jgi:glycosyltransferase involved in cell wall biosynthesis
MFIGDAISSALAQSIQDIEIVIVDNSRDCDRLTANTVAAYNDPRINYSRGDDGMTAVESWNKCVFLARGDFILILSDDDRLGPMFLEQSLLALEENRSSGFSFTHANKVTLEWKPISRWGYNFLEAGHCSGDEYLKFTLLHRCCISLSSTVLVRRETYTRVGGYQPKYAINTFDFNFYLRAARYFDVSFIDECLVDYRIHHGQLSEEHWRSPATPTGKIGTYLELLGLIGDLGEPTPTLPAAFLRERIGTITQELGQLLSTTFTRL